MGKRGRRSRNRDKSGDAGDGKSDRGKRNAKKKDERRQENALVEWTKSIVIAVILFLIIKTFLLHTFVIISGSMEETLLVGDMLVVNRASLGSRIPFTQVRVPGYTQPQRGDVIVFDPPHEEDLKLVKRLIGLPGDTLEMRSKVLYINGEQQDEPYVQHVDTRGDDRHPWMSWQRDFLAPSVVPETYSPTRDNWGPLVVPEEQFFMMGDNRDTSLDSRYWGFLERWRLEGRAVFVYFSYEKESLKPFPWITDIRWGRIVSGIH